ncbi:Peroxisomal Targeting Signal 2 Receptor [Manis pentadactyla]|nr:Peroxisomal Targeting Signal 2 Receptor [Manis pentadactyla]
MEGEASGVRMCVGGSFFHKPADVAAIMFQQRLFCERKLSLDGSSKQTNDIWKVDITKRLCGFGSHENLPKGWPQQEEISCRTLGIWRMSGTHPVDFAPGSCKKIC